MSINPKNKPDSHLEYIILDCAAAISANPLGSKVPEYWADAKAAQDELDYRARRRIDRNNFRSGFSNGIGWKLNKRAAAVALYWDKICQSK